MLDYNKHGGSSELQWLRQGLSIVALSCGTTHNNNGHEHLYGMERINKRRKLINCKK